MSWQGNVSRIGIALMLMSGPAFAQRVAIMGSPADPAWNGEVQSKLVATGLFATVDRFDIHDVTPTLSQMQSYWGILAYTDAAPEDSTTFGNNLADYVDRGGGVVAAVFATGGIEWDGRFTTDDYWAIEPNLGADGPEQTLGTIFVPGSPLLIGVSTFDGGTKSSRPARGGARHGVATRVPGWSGSD